MKTRFKVLLMAITLTGLYACSKSSPADDSTPIITTTASTDNTAVYYVDTFRVYSTDFKGANRKVVVDEDIKSNNNYISNTTSIPDKGIIVYSYTTGYADGSTIRTVTTDGTTKKTIKTIPAGTAIYFLKGISDGHIYYSTGTSAATAKAYVMNADGSGETQITGIPSAEAGTYIPEQQIPGQGVGVLCNDGYYMSFTTSTSGTLTTPLFNEGGSFYILTNETDASVVKMALSADGTKAAVIYKTATAMCLKLELKIIPKQILRPHWFIPPL